MLEEIQRRNYSENYDPLLLASGGILCPTLWPATGWLGPDQLSDPPSVLASLAKAGCRRRYCPCRRDSVFLSAISQAASVASGLAVSQRWPPRQVQQDFSLFTSKSQFRYGESLWDRLPLSNKFNACERRFIRRSYNSANQTRSRRSTLKIRYRSMAPKTGRCRRE